MVSVECGRCHARYLVKPQHAGKTIRCPKCGNGVTIPGGQAEVLSEVTAINPTGERLAGTASPDPHSPRHKKLLIALGGLAGVALGVAVGGLALWFFAGSASTPNQPPQTAVQAPDSQPQPPSTNSPGKPQVKVASPPAKKPAPMDPTDGGPLPKLPALADLIEKLDDGVVLITAFDESGERVAEGSGFVLDASGLIATNYHVLDDAHTATVQLRDGTKIDVAGVRGCDSEGDLLIIELAKKPEKLEVLPLAPDAPLRQGADVIALGHPRGFRFTVSNGIISAVRKTKELPEEVADELDAHDDYLWVQTTAAISGGNSGGPLLNRLGQVIGINTWIAAGENLAFAAHVRHLEELRKRLNAKAEPLAEFNPRQRKIDEKLALKRFKGKLERACREALALKWKADSAADYRKLSHMAGGLWFAAKQKAEPQQIEGVRKSLRGIKWTYQDYIRPLNDMAAATIDTFGSGVVFLGEITTVSTFRQPGETDRKKFAFRLMGRGYHLWVEDLSGRSDWKLGDTCLVLGARTSFGRDPESPLRQIHQIEAAIVEPVKLEDVPADTALRVLRDFIQYRRQGPSFVKTLQQYAPNFPALAYDAKDEKVAWYKYMLNRAGHGFDALRLTTPAGERRDFVWHVAGPAEGMASWYIAPLKGSMSGFRNFFRLPNFREEGLDLPEENFSFLQSLSGRNFKPESDYILWFTFTTDKPVDVYVRARLAPQGSVDNTGRGLRTALDAKRVPGPVRVASADPPQKQPMAKAKVKTEPPPQVPDPSDPPDLTPDVAKQNREATEYILQYGRASVQVKLQRGGQWTVVTVRNPNRVLPMEPFYLVNVTMSGSLSGSEEQIQDLSRLSGLTQLHRLYALRNEIGEKAIATLKDLPALTTLALSGDAATDATIAHIKRFKTLTSLILSGSQRITDEGVSELKELKQLGQLNLSETAISDDSATVISGFARLMTLDLAGTQLTDPGVAEIAKLKRLINLDLTGTKITDASLKVVAGLPMLASLSVGDTQVTEGGLAALTRMPRLRNLRLGGILVGETGLKHLSKMRSLVTLFLRGSGVTEEQEAQLQKSLPNCRIYAGNRFKGKAKRRR